MFPAEYFLLRHKVKIIQRGRGIVFRGPMIQGIFSNFRRGKDYFQYSYLGRLPCPDFFLGEGDGCQSYLSIIRGGHKAINKTLQKIFLNRQNKVFLNSFLVFQST